MRKKSLVFPGKEELRSRMQLKEQDEQLLRMLFTTHVTPDEKTAFFKNLDIEKEPMEFNLMLAHLYHLHGAQGIPSTIIPRLLGVARFYLFKNGALFSSFRPLQQALNQAGIPVLLLKGAAIKATYEPNRSRCLADIDFAVPIERLNDTIKIAQNQDFHFTSNSLHSVDMKQSGITGIGGSIDIHHKLFKICYSRSMDDEIKDGARLTKFFGTEVWVPSPENLLFHLLENEFYNLCSITNSRRCFKWIYDSGTLLHSSLKLDWDHLANTAKKYSLYNPIQSMLSLLADYFPQYVPKTMLIHNSPLEQSQNINQMERVIFANLDLCIQGAKREKLRSAGKKWRSLLLWPSQIATEYRMLRYIEKVQNLREFILFHCRAKNFYEVMSWLLVRIRTWNRGEKKE